MGGRERLRRVNRDDIFGEFPMASLRWCGGDDHPFVAVFQKLDRDAEVIALDWLPRHADKTGRQSQRSTEWAIA